MDKMYTSIRYMSIKVYDAKIGLNTLFLYNNCQADNRNSVSHQVC